MCVDHDYSLPGIEIQGHTSRSKVNVQLRMSVVMQ